MSENNICLKEEFGDQSFLNYFCVKKHEGGEEIVKICCCVGFVIFEAQFIFALKKALAKKKKVTQPELGRSNDDTYNILAKYQIDTLIFLLVFVILDQIYTLTIILIGAKIGIHITLDCYVDHGLMFHIWMMIKYFEMMLLLIILMLQFSEWIFVNYMINSQENRSIG